MYLGRLCIDGIDNIDQMFYICVDLQLSVLKRSRILTELLTKRSFVLFLLFPGAVHIFLSFPGRDEVYSLG